MSDSNFDKLTTEEIEPYSREVLSLTVAEFCTRHGGRFLVKFPVHALPLSRQVAVQADGPTREIGWSGDPWAGRWMIVELPGGQARYSVGRALSSALNLRLPFLSKTHCFLEVGLNGTLVVRDDNSHNGTYYNGMRLAPGGAFPVNIGDELGFGVLRLQVLDARRLYHVVREHCSAEQG